MRRCNSCEVVMINGVRCHETGCPERWKDELEKCRECGCAYQREFGGQRICEDCANPPELDDDILVADAKPGDASKQGIHLLNPTNDELERAREEAAVKGFTMIYRHTDYSWPKGDEE